GLGPRPDRDGRLLQDRWAPDNRPTQNSRTKIGRSDERLSARPDRSRPSGPESRERSRHADKPDRNRKGATRPPDVWREPAIVHAWMPFPRILQGEWGCRR